MIKNIVSILSLSFLLVSSITVFCMDDGRSYFVVASKGIPCWTTRLTISKYHPDGNETKFGQILIEKMDNWQAHAWISTPDDLDPIIDQPSSVSLYRKMMKTLKKKKYDFDESALLRDWDIPSFDQWPSDQWEKDMKMIIMLVRNLLSNHVKNIIAFPCPLMSEDKQLDETKIDEKMKKLIELYGKCGFKKIDDNQNIMVWKDPKSL